MQTVKGREITAYSIHLLKSKTQQYLSLWLKFMFTSFVVFFSRYPIFQVSCCHSSWFCSQFLCIIMRWRLSLLKTKRQEKQCTPTTTSLLEMHLQFSLSRRKMYKNKTSFTRWVQVLKEDDCLILIFGFFFLLSGSQVFHSSWSSRQVNCFLIKCIEGN